MRMEIDFEATTVSNSLIGQTAIAPGVLTKNGKKMTCKVISIIN
jgi:hypothetical protein